jgi:hypothetical protein
MAQITRLHWHPTITAGRNGEIMPVTFLAVNRLARAFSHPGYTRTSNPVVVLFDTTFVAKVVALT